MASTTHNSISSDLDTQSAALAKRGERRFPTLRPVDAGKVRLGGQGPVFRLTSDNGKVRLGGQGPVFRFVSDAGRVRLGGQGPAFLRVADLGKVRLGGQGPAFR